MQGIQVGLTFVVRKMFTLLVFAAATSSVPAGADGFQLEQSIKDPMRHIGNWDVVSNNNKCKMAITYSKSSRKVIGLEDCKIPSIKGYNSWSSDARFEVLNIIKNHKRIIFIKQKNSDTFTSNDGNKIHIRRSSPISIIQRVMWMLGW